MYDIVNDVSTAVNPTETTALPHPRRLPESAWVFISSLVFYLTVAVYLVYGEHYYAGDALSRVANAYYVLFSQNPHLGAIGMVWNPLPSVLELPIVALHPWFPQVVTQGLAGDAVTAVLGAFAVTHLNAILRTFSLPRLWRWALVLAFGFNPLVVLYSANGMSDMMWVACILGTYRGVLGYLETGSLRRLISGALWLAAGFGMRYEAVPFGACVIAALMAAQWGRTERAQWQGSGVLLGAPIVFAGMVWIYFNWMLMKDPLYFLNSAYSNLAQTSTGAYMTRGIVAADHHVLGALLYVVRFGFFYWPLFLAWPLALGLTLRRRADRRALVLVAGTVGAELLELALVYQGHLGEWDRYFLEFIPNGIVLTGWVLSQAWPWLSRRWLVWRGMALAVVGALILSGSVGTYFALQHSELGHPDGQVIDWALAGRSMKSTADNPFTEDQTVIDYVDQHPGMTILADTFTDWPVVIRAKHLNQFVITSDYDFEAILHNPRGRVSAFLVPEPLGVATLNAINRAYPNMWAGGVSWVRLLKSFPGGLNYRLYQVLPSAP
ncbi:MAG: hypothetical protein OWU84_10345 [Firmicutes bacterium]|nr:hypothetical protein [Bacillota bacterium]